MLIKTLFATDVTRDIAPVVYFHEQTPERIKQEVSEYIITGGHPEGSAHHKRLKSGIHEQFVRLLTGLNREIQRSSPTALPASWISGFYGSGKSSFAKLLGLALDGIVLDDGRTVGQHLLDRDDSPNAAAFRNAWSELRAQIDPMAVVFDIGVVARDREQIHNAARRQIQKRLGYCAQDHVAEYELKLELEGQWNDFLDACQEVHGRPWDELIESQFADESFSAVIHHLRPHLYAEPMDWCDMNAGNKSNSGTSVSETTQTIARMLQYRAPNKTLFLVIDEVSQYVHQSDNRMLALQSFVEDLGQKLGGRVWLLATGQQKLDDASNKLSIGKLKDRFPPRLRVHLDATNIRDVVHKRLLKKDPSQVDVLRREYRAHNKSLKLFGFDCSSIVEEDFVDVYPLLPGYIDLLMQITSSLRLQSTRIQGDDHAIRGLLQLLGELFRELKLAEMPLGALVSLDHVYEIQRTALSADVQNTMARVMNHEALTDDILARRVARAVALLQTIQDQRSTHVELLAQCLYNKLGAPNNQDEVAQAAERLRQLGFLSYTESRGYKLQSSAGGEWKREREQYAVTAELRSEVVRTKLLNLLGKTTAPLYRGKKFPWSALYNDQRSHQNARLKRTSEQAVVMVDFNYLTRQEAREDSLWINQSAQRTHANHLVWVCGPANDSDRVLRELVQSKHIIEKYESRRDSLPHERQHLFFEEQTRREELENKASQAVADLFMRGALFFRGRKLDLEHQSTFQNALSKAGEEILPDLYSLFINIAITPKELEQLFADVITGASSKFQEHKSDREPGLGLLTYEGGRSTPTCTGSVPQKIKHHIEAEGGVLGASLIAYFGAPPYGYAVDVIHACLIGLLRAGAIRVQPSNGAAIVSVKDPGARELFKSSRSLNQARLMASEGGGLTAREKSAITKFFRRELNEEIPREMDAIANAAFEHFPSLRDELAALKHRLTMLPKPLPLPEPLRHLSTALVDCTRSRHIEPTAFSVRDNLGALKEGLPTLKSTQESLTTEAVQWLQNAQEMLSCQTTQLRDIGEAGTVQREIKTLEEHLQRERPWVEAESLAEPIDEIRVHYTNVRRELIQKHEKKRDNLLHRLKLREGFNDLTHDQIEQVQRLVHRLAFDTTPNKQNPTLLTLRDQGPLKLTDAEQQANTMADEFIEGEIIPINLGLAGREINSVQQLDELLDDIRRKVQGRLGPTVRIRLI